MPTYDQLTWQSRQFGNEIGNKLTSALAFPPAKAVSGEAWKRDRGDTYLEEKAAAAVLTASGSGGLGGYENKAAGATFTAAGSGGLGGYEIVKKRVNANTAYTRQELLLGQDNDLKPIPAGGTLTSGANGGLGGYEIKAAGATLGAGGGFEVKKLAVAPVTPKTMAQILLEQAAHRDALKDRADSITNLH